MYSMALRELWEPQGWQVVADLALQDVAPVLFLIFFFSSRYKTLRAPDAAWALLLPFA